MAGWLGKISLIHLAIVALIVGGLTALFQPTLQASLPGLAGDSRTLQGANALFDVTNRLAFIIGPGLAGFLIALMPLPHFFTLDAVTVVMSAFAIMSIRQSFSQPSLGGIAAPSPAGFSGIWADIMLALKLINQNRPVFWSFVGLILMNLLWGAVFTVGLALLIDQTFQAGVGAYGFVVTAYGVGNVISNVIVGGVTVPPHQRVKLLFAGHLVVGIGFVLLAFAPTYSMVLLCAAIAALGGPMTDIMLILMIQEEFATNHVGKIYSVRMTVASGGFSLGLILAAPLFAVLEPSRGIALYAIGMMGVGLLGIIRFSYHVRSWS